MLIGEGVLVLWGQKNACFPLETKSSIQLLSAAALAVISQITQLGSTLHYVFDNWVKFPKRVQIRIKTVEGKTQPNRTKTASDFSL